jgi:hypothetical protein
MLKDPLIIFLVVVFLAAVGYFIFREELKPKRKAGKTKSIKVNKGFLLWARYRLWFALAALIIVVIIAVRPMYWLGSSGLGWVLFWLIVAAGILTTYSFHYIKADKMEICVLATTLFVASTIGTIWGGYELYNSSPELKASEVKTIVNYKLSGSLSGNFRVASAEYKGEGIWMVKYIDARGVRYYSYTENTGRWDNTPISVPNNTSNTSAHKLTPIILPK